MKIAFLDRDGTIIKDYADDVWPKIKTTDFIEGNFEALKGIISQEYKIIIITNQYLIGEAYISEQDYLNFTKNFLDILKSNNIKIYDIFYCPHARDNGCECLKPKPGLIHKTCLKYPEIDLSKSFMCGDSISDFELAQVVGLKFFGVGNLKPKGNEFIYIPSLAQITCYIT